MQDISGNVTGKIQFKIDKASWQNLDNFSKKLTNIKRQMGGLDKTIKVQQVVQQIKTVGDKVAKASVAAKKQEYNGHVAAYQKYQQQMNKMYDQAIREDRRRDNQKIRQADTFNRQQLRSDLAKDRMAARASGRPSVAAGYIGSRNYDARAERYTATKLLQAEIAGVKGKDMDKLRSSLQSSRNIHNVTRDFDALKHSMQQATKISIENSRQMRKNAVTFGSVRSELLQLTAAYTAFAGVQNIAQTGLDMESLRASARVFAGDDAGVAEHMQFISDEAERLGTNLMSATKEFTKFSIATKMNMSKSDQRLLFTGMSEYAAVLGVNQQDYERAFRAVQQIASKGQVYKEELTQQLGEALGGSVQAMMRAAGFSNEKEFFKAVEAGQVMSDVLPKFAIELKRMAREGGALDKVINKTRAEMNRFLSDLTRAKDAIFQGGLDEGLSYMFGSLSQMMKDFAPAAKAFGGAFKGAISTITAALRVLVSPLQVVTNLLASWDISDRASSWLWNVVGAGGALALMAMGFNRIAVAIGLANTGLLVMMGRLAAMAVPALVIQDMIGSKFGLDSVIPNVSWDDITKKTGGVSSNFNFTKLMNGQNPFEVTVHVIPDGSEFSKAVKANVASESQKQQANLASETGG